jgi:DNA-binding XRE family transcriptional regulator
VSKKQPLLQKNLAPIARRFRKQAGKTRAQAAREMGVAQTSIFNAEESPGQSLLKLRMRMIQAYSSFKVIGPFYHLKKVTGKTLVPGRT